MSQKESTKGVWVHPDGVKRNFPPEGAAEETAPETIEEPTKTASKKASGRPRGSLPTIKDHEKELREALRLLKEGPKTEAQWRLYFNTVARPKGWARRTYEKISETGKNFEQLMRAQEKNGE